MSRYDYAGSYGKPVSVGYDVGRGTRTYVTRVEERVEQVRRPSTMGYAYYSTMKAEKEGRPREVDNFITKLLDEVNGPTVSTTTRSFEPVRDLYGLPAKVNPTKDYGVGYKFGDDSPTTVDGRRGYYVEYTYVGSRNYGDPYDQQDWSRNPSGNPGQNDYGVPYQSGNSRLMSEIPRDYQAPKNRWETSSRPISDALPYNPPHLEYYSSNSYGAKPESPRDHGVPNNQLKSEMAKDYRVPNNQRNNSSVKPMSPKAYEGSGDQWSRPLTPTSLDIQGDYSPVKPYSSDGYGIIDNEKGGSASPRYAYPPKIENIGGSPNNRWGNSPSKPIYQTRPYEDNIGDRDCYPGNSSLNPQSPKNYGVSHNPNYGQQSSPSMKPQSPKASAVPKNYRGRSPSPKYEHPPRNNLVGSVASNKWGDSPLKTQSPRDYGTRDNQWDRPSSPVANKGDGTPHGREVKLGSPRDYEVPNDQKERSISPGYEHPPRNVIGGIPSNRYSNSPLKTQSPLDYGPRDNQWGKPSNRNDLSNVASKNDGTPDGRQVKLGSPKDYNEIPKDQKGRSTSPEYEHPPRNEIISPPPSNGWNNPSLKVQIPQDDAGRTNRGSSDYNSPQPLGNGVGVANNRWPNAPVKTQSPRDHGSPVNQVGSPSSPVYNGYNNESKNVQPNVAIRDAVPASGNKPNVTNNTYDPARKGDYGGSGTMKPSSGYQSSPLSQATSPLGRVSDKTGDSLGQQRVSGGASSQPKYSIYSAPVSQVVTVKPGVVHSMEAQRGYGNLGASSRSYIEDEEHGKPVITSRDAVKKYNGFLF